MQETSLLGIFVALPVILCVLLFLFFRKFKQHRKSPRWLSLLVGNSLVLLFLCSIVLVSGEIYYDFYHDTTDSFGLTKATARWFERHFQTNNTPFRDSVYYMPTIQPGKRRVTFLGDSFTAGHGVPNVEDRFANRIRAANPSHEVHVLALCGWDTGPQLSFMTAVQGDYEMDLVILVYCLNDVADIVPEWERVLDRVYESSRPGYLVEHSYFLNTLYFRWKAARDPDVSNYYQFVHDNYQGPIWEKQKQRLKSLRDNVRSNDGQLLVVVEWAGRAPALLPADHLALTLTDDGPDGRFYVLDPCGPRAKRWAVAALEVFSLSS